MQIAVSGRQLDIGEAFHAHATSELDALKDKYFPRAIGATVTLSPGPHNDFSCEIIMHVMHDVLLKGSGRSEAASAAFDIALAKIDKQLRRYMGRLKNRSSPGGDSPPSVRLNANYTVFQPDGADEEEGEEEGAPLVVAEAQVDVPDASVADAVMMLDLRNTTALLFKNSGSGEYNMVYRRDDGNIGWVEPGNGEGRRGAR